MWTVASSPSRSGLRWKCVIWELDLIQWEFLSGAVPRQWWYWGCTRLGVGHQDIMGWVLCKGHEQERKQEDFAVGLNGMCYKTRDYQSPTKITHNRAVVRMKGAERRLRCSWAEDQLANLMCSETSAGPRVWGEDKFEPLFTGPQSRLAALLGRMSVYVCEVLNGEQQRS